MAVAAHCARTHLSIVCGASSSSRIAFTYYKYCALSEPTLLHKKIREPSQFQYRKFIVPQSSLKELSCKQLANEMDEQWSHDSSYSFAVSSAQPSIKKSDVKKQGQDHQPHQPQNLEGDAHFAGLSNKEIDRRQKIGAANKGKVPWTKGRKWSEEHKKLIKQRTTEALRDPKVRKKMLGHRQLHRQASKDKISAALTKIWERRIVCVKSRQRVLEIWSNSIAEAAKEGNHNQDKLDWDSYDRIKSEMISLFLWKKEREQIIKKLKKAVAKIAAKKLQEAGRKVLTRGTTKKSKPEKLLLQKSESPSTKVVVPTRPKLKERLTKWHCRKKELETVISSRARKGGLQEQPRRQLTA
ncbi:uncharacterized protein LOC133929513 [Phragmites australis]|uniref:uncharacterized protein LOC133929513 n=1 Tax=Phragmites australis TaxID=29695 RepID=UPI002D779A2A|nr:uncharacterized protein LOC133929513 [Phragmites australis]